MNLDDSLSFTGILDAILDSASRNASNVAIRAPDRTLNYQELLTRVSSVTAKIEAGGIPSNRRIGVLTGVESDVYINILGILFAGCAYVPLNCHNPPARNTTIVQEAELELILAHCEHESVLDIGTKVSVFDVAGLESAESLPSIPDLSPTDLAYIFFTSGSTGKPKGVPISHAALCAFVDKMCTWSGTRFSENDRFLQMFDLTFDLSVMSYVVPLCVGASFSVVPEGNSAAISVSKVLREHNITIALMVPSTLTYLERYFDEIALPNLRLSLFCGEALPESLARGWQKCALNAAIQNVYGPTECTIFCFRYDYSTAIDDDDIHAGVVSIGKPMSGIMYQILDDTGEDVSASVGRQGELCLFGDQLATEYLNNPQKTRDVFFQDKALGRGYRTGDICQVNRRGNVMYLGRSDQQVKLDGFRVELGEIEHCARQAAGAGACVAVVAQDVNGANVLHLFVEQVAAPSKDIIGYMSERVPKYMTPKKVHRLAELPLNQSGKVDRPALLKLAT